MFGQLKARTEVAVAAIGYGNNPTPETEERLIKAIEVYTGKTRDQWSEADRQMIEDAKAQRPQI